MECLSRGRAGARERTGVRGWAGELANGIRVLVEISVCVRQLKGMLELFDRMDDGGIETNNIVSGGGSDYREDRASRRMTSYRRCVFGMTENGFCALFRVLFDRLIN
jgi:hypothetical protein